MVEKRRPEYTPETTEKKMTDTPRTHEEMWTTDYHHELCNVVNTEFARQLERELTEAKAEVERLWRIVGRQHDLLCEHGLAEYGN